MNTKLSGIEHIGTRQREARLEAHLTQGQLAELSGTNQPVIQKIENGHSSRPRLIMEIAEALNVNPAWLQFGEPYARKQRPGGNSAKTPEATPEFELATWLTLADRLLRQSKKAQLAETARLLALNLAHYQIRFGEIPLKNFQELMETQEFDSKTARLVATGMENLVGVLGLVATQDEAANSPTH